MLRHTMAQKYIPYLVCVVEVPLEDTALEVIVEVDKEETVSRTKRQLEGDGV